MALFLYSPRLVAAQDPVEQLRAESESEEDAIVAKQRLLIETELAKRTNDEWSGEYYYGDGLGVNVTLLFGRAAGFVYTWTGCMGTYDQNYGAAQYEGNKLILSPKLLAERKGVPSIPLEFYLVRWSSRHYLIPATDIINFANHVNRGFEPRKSFYLSSFLLKKGEEKVRVAGFPQIPPEYSGYLLQRPINAEVVSVGRVKPLEYGRTFPIVISVGWADGVKAGMEFDVYQPKNTFATAKVLKVDEHSSEAEVTQYNQDEAVPEPKWKLSTKPKY